MLAMRIAETTHRGNFDILVATNRATVSAMVKPQDARVIATERDNLSDQHHAAAEQSVGPSSGWIGCPAMYTVN